MDLKYFFQSENLSELYIEKLEILEVIVSILEYTLTSEYCIKSANGSIMADLRIKQKQEYICIIARLKSGRYRIHNFETAKTSELLNVYKLIDEIKNTLIGEKIHC